MDLTLYIQTPFLSYWTDPAPVDDPAQIEAVILTGHIIASTIRECWAVVVDGFDACGEQAYDPA